MKNICLKTRNKDHPYEVWKADGGWTWKILKKYQINDDVPFARWLCYVESPYCPNGEMGDVYVTAIQKKGGRKIEEEGKPV